MVTLEPIDNEIEEAVDLAFVPARGGSCRRRRARSRVAADDAPEPLVGGVVDLGAVATEFLSLGIDPYPRKSGADSTRRPRTTIPPHPFAALAALKKGQGGS